MPSREEERERRTKDDLRYCVFCKRYLSPIAWDSHPHNPERKGNRKVKRILWMPFRKFFGLITGSK